MSTNRPKRNKKPSSRFEDFICSNQNVKSVSSSTVKVGKEQGDECGMEGSESGVEKNYSGIDYENLNVRISDETRKENRDYNNGEKQDRPEDGHSPH
ncbi:hypothetical protein Tco_1015028 [Tanacetum coccineum]|uniref:Uncharacterized protein n=1 Tax=Tanacetum coccineum TaxID=301880 RepID=A0ABQ5FKN8_9ASTR